jgi:hypothetical protein
MHKSLKSEQKNFTKCFLNIGSYFDFSICDRGHYRWLERLIFFIQSFRFIHNFKKDDSDLHTNTHPSSKEEEEKENSRNVI